MSSNAIKTFNGDVSKLHKAQDTEEKAKTTEAKANTAEKTDTTKEKAELASITAQATAITDQFQTNGATMTPAQQQKLLGQMYSLGEKQVQTQDTYKTTMADAKKTVAKDAKDVATDKKDVSKTYSTAKDALRAAEYQSSLKETNAERKEVGLGAVKKVIRPANTGANAIKAAQSVLGQNIESLKYSGPLAKYLDKWPADTVCCANFVSACLEKAGQISPSQHSDSVAGLADNLSQDSKFEKVSSSDMKPGDVVCFNVPGEGSYSHVEMFLGYKNGVPEFIGSNNVNSDGSQRISEGNVGYPIAAVFRYK